jgi:hypothetical protein
VQSVDIKLLDRGGELHFAVHSANPDLTTDLRATVHDLVGGLEKSGFHTDTWQPGDPQSQAQSDADPRQQARQTYQPDPSPSRRNRGPNFEWMNQISALTGAERND